MTLPKGQRVAISDQVLFDMVDLAQAIGFKYREGSERAGEVNVQKCRRFVLKHARDAVRKYGRRWMVTRRGIMSAFPEDAEDLLARLGNRMAGDTESDLA